jgi:hypothetical protein
MPSPCRTVDERLGYVLLGHDRPSAKEQVTPR